MAALDWSQCPAVESIPGKVSGAWVFKGTRLPVATVIENLEDLSIDEVIEQFDVTREQVAAVLEFVAQSLRAIRRPRRCSSSLTTARRRGCPRVVWAHRPHGAIQGLGHTQQRRALERRRGGRVRAAAHDRPAHPPPAEPARTPHRPRRPDGQHQVVARSATCRAHRCRRGFRDAWQLRRGRDSLRAEAGSRLNQPESGPDEQSAHEHHSRHGLDSKRWKEYCGR